jgi:hypothetical protein
MFRKEPFRTGVLLVSIFATGLLATACSSTATTAQSAVATVTPEILVTSEPTQTSTPAPSSTPKVTATPKATTTPRNIIPDNIDYNCSDFSTYIEAQAYFNAQGGSPSNNVDGLDADHDGIACESLK